MAMGAGIDIVVCCCFVCVIVAALRLVFRFLLFCKKVKREVKA